MRISCVLLLNPNKSSPQRSCERSSVRLVNCGCHELLSLRAKATVIGADSVQQIMSPVCASSSYNWLWCGFCCCVKLNPRHIFPLDLFRRQKLRMIHVPFLYWSVLLSQPCKSVSALTNSPSRTNTSQEGTEDTRAQMVMSGTTVAGSWTWWLHASYTKFVFVFAGKESEIFFNTAYQQRQAWSHCPQELCMFWEKFFHWQKRRGVFDVLEKKTIARNTANRDMIVHIVNHVIKARLEVHNCPHIGTDDIPIKQTWMELHGTFFAWRLREPNVFLTRTARFGHCLQKKTTSWDPPSLIFFLIPFRGKWDGSSSNFWHFFALILIFF